MADSKSSFWSSLLVFIERPNVINKRVMGCHVLHCWQIDRHFNTIYELMRKCSLIQIKQNLIDCKEYCDFKFSQIKSIEGSVLVVRQLLLKQSLKHLNKESNDLNNLSSDNSSIIEFILIDIPNSQTIFVPKVKDNQIVPESCYKFFLSDSEEIELEFLSDSLPSLWLSQTVLPKLRQWMRQELEGHQFQGSLQLIGVDQYCLTYNTLKSRYASHLVELWKQNETTDPLKFVFEDIAIASYLIVLWNQENEKNGSKNKPSFVDLGCGNGLLVYLLTNEGFRGIGIDLRKRKIWDKYGSNVKLLEKVFTPSDDSLKFSEYDWLIGNHSDELTPWYALLVLTFHNY
jgi:tRNASer (uridine44-2'-O)-methyltransferase